MFFAIPAAMTAIGAGIDIYGAVKGAQQAKQAEADLRKFVEERDKLQFTDKMQSLQVGQRGEDLASANLAQQGGQMLNTLQDAGSAALIGGVGALAQNMSDQNLQIGANLSERAYANEALKARNAQMIENLNTQYKMDNVQQDIMGAQSAYAQGMDQKWAGLSGVAGAMGGLANSYLEYSDLYKGEDGGGDASASRPGRGAQRREARAAERAAAAQPETMGQMGLPDSVDLQSIQPTVNAANNFYHPALNPMQFPDSYKYVGARSNFQHPTLNPMQFPNSDKYVGAGFSLYHPTLNAFNTPFGFVPGLNYGFAGKDMNYNK